MKHFLLLLLVCVTSTAWANFNDAVNQTRVQEHTQLINAQALASRFNQLSGQTVLAHLPEVQQTVLQAQHSLNQQLPRHTGGQAADGAMLFISFSMPHSLILQMMQQAARYHIPVLLRGLVHNQMRPTLTTILNLKLEAEKHHQAFTGLGIDPVWFAQFHINAVPALVITHRPASCLVQHQCPHQPFDVIAGNQSIHDSLVEFAREGSPQLRPIAKRLLQQAGETL